MIGCGEASGQVSPRSRCANQGRERINAMNDTTTTPDQADEDILAHDVSDEALEAAAGSMGDDPMRSLVALTGRGPGDCC
jgi:hypothetical protein